MERGYPDILMKDYISTHVIKEVFVKMAANEFIKVASAVYLYGNRDKKWNEASTVKCIDTISIPKFIQNIDIISSIYKLITDGLTALGFSKIQLVVEECTNNDEKYLKLSLMYMERSDNIDTDDTDLIHDHINYISETFSITIVSNMKENWEYFKLSDMDFRRKIFSIEVPRFKNDEEFEKHLHRVEDAVYRQVEFDKHKTNVSVVYDINEENNMVIFFLTIIQIV